MNRHPHVTRLIQIIDHYGLDRDDDVAQYRLMAEAGMLGDDLAQGLLAQLEPRIEQAIDHPLHLHRPPTEEDLYAEGRPQLELGHLLEAPLRFGINLTGCHTVIAATTGAGKTTCIRRIIQAIEELGDD